MSDLPEEAAVLYRVAQQDRLAFQTLLENSAVDLRIVGFHAQQAVEKTLKAVLAAAGVIFPPTHNLLKLTNLLAQNAISPPLPDDQLSKLNPYAVMFRYDDRELHTADRNTLLVIVDAVFVWADARLCKLN